MEKENSNYTIPSLARQKIPQIQPLKVEKPFYASHYLPQEYQVPCCSLLNHQIISPEAIKSKVYKKPNELTLLTYNVWFQEVNNVNRYPCLIKIIADSGADFICLQEVNDKFMDILLSAPEKYKSLGLYYYCKTEMYDYDTLILSRYPCKFYKKLFGSTRMGRCALTAVVQFAHNQNKMVLGINCVHLQSLYYSRQRESQLEFIKELNQHVDLSIIAGDFNFGDDEWGDNKRQIKAIQQYVDVWKKGKRRFSKWATEAQKERGFTMPTNLQFPCWRPDKVLYKYKNSKQNEGDQIEIVGDFTISPYQHQVYQKIQDDGKVRTPSDHFGLIAKIIVQQ